MKTIYLRVDVPDYFVIDKDIDLMDYANHYIEFTEIQLPSEEEIRNGAEKKYPKRYPAKFLQQWDKTLRRLYVEAQMELLNKLKGE